LINLARVVILVALALGASPSVAQELSVFTGVGVGVFDHRNATDGPFSQSVSSWKFYGGFQVGRYFSIEGGAEWPGTLEAEVPGSLTIATRRFDATYAADIDLITVKAMGRLPIKRFDLWFAYGSFSMDADVDFEFTLNSIVRRTSLSVEDTGELVALGVDWRLGRVDRRFDLRLEYERMEFPFSEASAVNVCAAFRFGDL
jgi:hypothetical protein